MTGREGHCWCFPLGELADIRRERGETGQDWAKQSHSIFENSMLKTGLFTYCESPQQTIPSQTKDENGTQSL